MLRSKDIRPDAVALYIRWSTEEQGEGTTLEIQRERCSLFVRSQGWMVREDLTFIDEGFSGANLERPSLQRLRMAVEAGLVDCVVSYKLDRLSRNLVDTVTLVRQEWAGKCIYRSATEGFDTSGDSPTGGLIFNILASFAEFERAVIRDRTRAGTMRRMKEGMYISGTVPFGYERAGKGQLAIKPGESETVRRMFQMVIENVVASATYIAKKLNQEGLPGPTGNKWWSSAVERILRNPLYTGTVIYGRRNLPPTVPGGEGRFDANGEALAAVEDAVPAIIDRETFEKAHAMLRQRKEAKPRNTNRASGEYLLTTIATCKCGGPLGAIKDRYGSVYYRCQRKQQGVGCSEGSVAFRGAPVEEKVGTALKARFGGTRKQVALRVLRARFESSNRRLEIEQAIKDTERRKAEVLEDLARLRRQARQGELKASTYEDFKADAEAEMRDLEDRLRDLHLSHATSGKDVAVLQQMEDALNAVDEWDTLAGAERKELLRSLCSRLEVLYRGRAGGDILVEVTWKE
ncbi:MAG TPA: recombinase family protein [Symbiobacteriaceae bacterium]|nr:recombinase family protein [Symbiobacteriaceae bacterium]